MFWLIHFNSSLFTQRPIQIHIFLLGRPGAAAMASASPRIPEERCVSLQQMLNIPSHVKSVSAVPSLLSPPWLIKALIR